MSDGGNHKDVFDKPHNPALRATIEDLLKAASIGDQVTWEAIEDACKMPRTGLYGAVRIAVRNVAPLGYKFITRSGIGVERIDDEAVVTEVLPARARRIQREGRRIRKTVASVDPLKIDAAKRLQLVGFGALGALAEAVAKPKAVKALGEQPGTREALKESYALLSDNKR